MIKDSIPPTFVAPEPVIVVITDLPKLGVTGFPTSIDDNCYVTNSIEFEDEWVKEPTCSETGLVKRKLTVLDECLNGKTVRSVNYHSTAIHTNRGLHGCRYDKGSNGY